MRVDVAHLESPGQEHFGGRVLRFSGWMQLGSGATGTLGPDEGRAALFGGSLGPTLFFGEDGDGWKPSFLGGIGMRF